VPKMVKKSDLPTKICIACGRPFTWRRKWGKNWSDVKFCSDRCRRSKTTSVSNAGPPSLVASNFGGKQNRTEQ